MENQNEKIISNAKTDPSKNMLSHLKIAPNTIKYGLIILAVLILLISGYCWYVKNQRVYSDKAEIFAPLIILSPEQPSLLQQIMVKNSDQVYANQAVAKLSDGELIRAKSDGIVVSINDEIGKLFTPGMPVITIINPDNLRLIVHVAENKGLNSIHIGQKVIFNVDAFGSKKFYGEVEEISQISDQSSVVFSISDKRDEKYFSIKVKYNNYPELFNGMSAKAWIYK